MDKKWSRARELRASMTEAEAALWRRLRSRQLLGYKFRRQYPIAGFIADFACVEAGLVVEVDGGQHDDQHAYDAARTNALMNVGYRVVRFWNNEVLENMEGVLTMLCTELSQPHPGPHLRGRGGRRAR